MTRTTLRIEAQHPSLPFRVCLQFPCSLFPPEEMEICRFLQHCHFMPTSKQLAHAGPCVTGTFPDLMPCDQLHITSGLGSGCQGKVTLKGPDSYAGLSGRHHSLTDPRVTRAGISAGEDMCPLTCHSPAPGPSATLQDPSQPVGWAGPCQAEAGTSRRAHPNPHTHTGWGDAG